MEMEIEWNLNPNPFFQISVYQIFDHEDDSINAKTINSKLLILSHFMSRSGKPSFFLEKSPPYIENKVNSAVAIIFDIDKKFQPSELPKWASFSEWNWIPKEYFTNILSDHFLRALTNVLYYKLIKYKPLYFTSFILIPSGELWSTPFLIQPVPVLRQDGIQIRTVIQSDLSCIVKPRVPPPVGTFILYPPNEHPLHVIDVFEERLSAMTIYNIPIKINFFKDMFVYLTNPPNILQYFFKDKITIQHTPQMAKNENSVPFTNFSNLDLFRSANETIVNGLLSLDDDKVNTKPLPAKEDAHANKDSNFSFIDILSDEISEMDVQNEILSCIGTGPSFPSKRKNLNCSKSFIFSYYSIDLTFSNNSSLLLNDFCQSSNIDFQRLGIPNVLVKYKGRKRQISADDVLENWEIEKYSPLMGEKNIFFAVFFIDSIDPDYVELFINQLRNIYKLYGFGSLTPYSKNESFIQISDLSIPTAIENFLNQNPLFEFQETPLLMLVISSKNHEFQFKATAIINYIDPMVVEDANEVEIKALSFVIYSRIRIPTAEPIDFVNVFNQPKLVFLCYRYQPPIILERSPVSMTSVPFKNTSHPQNPKNYSLSMHAAWDPVSKISVWIDDIGTVLRLLPADNVSKIVKFITQCRKLLNVIKIRFTLTIFGEGITESHYQDIDKKLPKEVELYSISPAPAIIAKFGVNNFLDDIITFDSPEQEFESNESYTPPQITCYVLSKFHPSYSVSLYRQLDKNMLINYAKEMSHLSWLTVKPGCKYRTTSYPPHIFALLKMNQCNTLVISRFEFLPPRENI